MSKTPMASTNPDGWSDWYDTEAEGFRVCCCDCGLTHDFQLRVLTNGEIEWRVSGNARATAAHRRWDTFDWTEKE